MTVQIPSSTALRTAAAALALALLPLAAAAQAANDTANDTPTTDAPAEWEVDDRVDRPEEGAMSGTVVLIDRENLILETADGDRAFALDGATRVPAVLRDSDDWAEVEGFPVEVVFRPGADGELRVVESLSLLPVESQETAEAEVESVTADAVPAAATTGPGGEGDVQTAALSSTDAPPEPAAAQAGDEPVVATASALRPGEPGTLAESADGGEDAPELASATATSETDRELPRTASRLPWIGLIGLLALGGAFGLAAVTRKV